MGYHVYLRYGGINSYQLGAGLPATIAGDEFVQARHMHPLI